MRSSVLAAFLNIRNLVADKPPADISGADVRAELKTLQGMLDELAASAN